MAADVLMGADAHAAAWIGRYGEGRSEAGSAGGRPGGRAGRRTAPRESRRRCLRRRDRGRGLARRLHALGETGPHRRRDEPARCRPLARGRLDSVCGAAVCGRCQVVAAEGEFAQHGIASRDHLTFSEPETRYRDGRPRRRPPPRVPCARDRRSRRRCAAGEPAASSGRARPMRTRSRSIRSFGCTTSRCVSPISRTRAGTCNA